MNDRTLILIILLGLTAFPTLIAVPLFSVLIDFIFRNFGDIQISEEDGSLIFRGREWNDYFSAGSLAFFIILLFFSIVFYISLFLLINDWLMKEEEKSGKNQNPNKEQVAVLVSTRAFKFTSF